ncbi:hypothetical protein HanIR_Chr14g0700411 [Helianthus annuus]|nr:hypothetical protein HanIR_Chr14g0700411 [Helianthus annuus]
MTFEEEVEKESQTRPWSCFTSYFNSTSDNNSNSPSLPGEVVTGDDIQSKA